MTFWEALVIVTVCFIISTAGAFVALMLYDWARSHDA